MTTEGTWTVLETNPHRQWAWIEDTCGPPITTGIADTPQATP